MTSLKKRMDNILAEFALLEEGLNRNGHYPSCCITVHNDGKISCDVKGPLYEKEFLEECGKCRKEIRYFVDTFKKAYQENKF